MAENKKAVIVYADWIDKFDDLTDEEAGKLIKHFFRYVNDLNPEPPDRITKLLFVDIKNSLKRDLEKWEKTLEGRSKAGKASAEKRRLAKLAEQEATNPTSVESVEKNPTNPTDSVSVSVTVSDSVKDINTIIDRESEFKNSLQQYLDVYGKDMLNNFYLYWTEKKPKGKKMLFEMQKTFDIKRRLERWNKNNFNNNNKTTNDEQQKLNDIANAIRERQKQARLNS